MVNTIRGLGHGDVPTPADVDLDVIQTLHFTAVLGLFVTYLLSYRYYAKVVEAVAKANDNQPVGAFVNVNNFHGRLYEPVGSQIIASALDEHQEEQQHGFDRPRDTRRHRHSRLKGTTGHTTAGTTASGGVDWFEAGRLHAGDILFTEDWFGDDYASEWSYLANRLRCAARLAPVTTATGVRSQAIDQIYRSHVLV